MKKKIVTAGGTILVLIMILVSVKYFRDSSFFEMEKREAAYLEKEEVSGNLPIQDEEPDEEIRYFAKRLEEDLLLELGEKGEEIQRLQERNPIEIDPWKVTTVGKEIREDNISYRVNDWKVMKEKPPYSYPDGFDSEVMKEYYRKYGQFEWDEHENLIKGGVYVTVSVTIKNLENTEISRIIWPTLILHKFGKDKGIDELSEAVYLGEENPREYGHDYGRETLPAKGAKTLTLIFLVEDSVLSKVEKEPIFYLEINPNGTGVVDSSHRWIVLNV